MTSTIPSGPDMRICLTNPFWRRDGKTGIRSGSRVPNMIGGAEHTFMPFPFPLAYAAACLERHGVQVLLIDAIAEDMSEDEYYRRVVAFQPDIIINELSTASYNFDRIILGRLKQLTGACICVCGPHVSALPADTLSECPDVSVVFVGEMDETIVEFVSRFNDPSGWKNISGMAYRTNSGDVSVNPRRPLIADIDTLPYPLRKHLRMDKYCVAGFPSPVLFMYGSRGCPYLCSFCLWPQTMFTPGSYRARKPSAIVEEIAAVWREHGPFASIYFDDDTFNIDRGRMFEFAAAMKMLPFAIPWGCNARPDLFDRETLTVLAEAGLFCIRIGIESGDQEVLNRAKKNLRLDSVRRCIELAHELGVSVHVSYTIGLPGESWDSVKKTVAFARSVSPDSVAFTITTPYPGTSYHADAARKNHLQTRNWDRYDGVENAIVRTETLSPEEIVRAERYVMRKVYYSPSYILRRFRYAATTKELAMLARKGLRLFLYR